MANTNTDLGISSPGPDLPPTPAYVPNQPDHWNQSFSLTKKKLSTIPTFSKQEFDSKVEESTGSFRICST